MATTCNHLIDPEPVAYWDSIHDSLIEDAIVAPSGFGWEDEDFRWLARTDSHFAYGPTSDAALTSLAEVLCAAE